MAHNETLYVTKVDLYALRKLGIAPGSSACLNKSICAVKKEKEVLTKSQGDAYIM